MVLVFWDFALYLHRLTRKAFIIDSVAQLVEHPDFIGRVLVLPGQPYQKSYLLQDSVAQLVEHPDFIGRVLVLPGQPYQKSYLLQDSVAQLVEHPDFIGRVLG